MKYTLDRSDTVTALNGATLYRIRYEDDTRGGYLQSTANLDPTGNARVSGNAQVYGNARVSGNAWVSGNARVSGDARVSGNAQVSKTSHYMTLGPLGSRNAFLTVCRDSKLGISYTTGCFFGSREAFVAAVESTHGDTSHGNAYAAAVMLADHVVPAFTPET